MIDTIANKLAASIKKANPEQTSSIEILQYSLLIYINTILIFVECLLIGWLTNKLLETLYCFIIFTILRFFSGGKHAGSVLVCNIVSTVLLTVIPHIANENFFLVLSMNIVSLFIVCIYAPNIDSETDIDRRYYPVLKVVSILIVTSNFYMQSGVMGMCLLAQSLTIIPWWERRGRL
jgi:accessory gene regulator B